MEEMKPVELSGTWRRNIRNKKTNELETNSKNNNKRK
jgi:hypothetical protein